MHVVIAPDSYKGSLTSQTVAEAMKKAVLQINAEAKVTLKPMADGGDGTLSALLEAIDGEKIDLICTGALGKKIHTHYAIIDSTTAVIEYALIAGLTQIPIKKRNPDVTTSFGMGEAILDALDRGCTSFIIGIGGSATNDGGLGMLLALGMRAWDELGKPVGMFGQDVLNIHSVCFKTIDTRLQNVSIQVASDVSNPLCGENGATYVYGPQKGITQEQLIRYDKALYCFGRFIETATHKPLINVPSAGAAGGLGFALLSLGATLVSGAELIARTIRLEDAIKEADFILTGEGKSDEQTLNGKAPGYVASLAQKYNVPTILISGSLSGDIDYLRELFTGCFSINTSPTTIEESITNAEQLLYEKTKIITHFIVNMLDR